MVKRNREERGYVGFFVLFLKNGNRWYMIFAGRDGTALEDGLCSWRLIEVEAEMMKPRNREPPICCLSQNLKSEAPYIYKLMLIYHVWKTWSSDNIARNTGKCDIWGSRVMIRMQGRSFEFQLFIFITRFCLPVYYSLRLWSGITHLDIQ